jgi:hypothetical protein
MLARTGAPDPTLLDFHRSRAEHLRQLLGPHSFAEIIALPEPEDVVAGRVKVALSAMQGGGTIYYTPEEYRLHLQNIIELLGTYENYQVHLTKRSADDQPLVYVKEDLGVIVARTSQPPVVLALSEGNMTTSFWDFLLNIIGEREYYNPDSEAVIVSLQAYLEKLTTKAET